MSDTVRIKFKLQLEFHHLTSDLNDIIYKLLKDKYLNKIYNRMVITYIDESKSMLISPMHIDTRTISIICDAKTFNYNVGDIVEGRIDIISNPPIFISVSLKSEVSGPYTRGIDYIQNDKGEKYYNNDSCKAEITSIKYIESSSNISGTVKI